MQKETRKPLWQVLTIFAALFLVLSVFLGLVYQFYVTPQAEENKIGYYSVVSKNMNAKYMLPAGEFTLTQSFQAKDSISAYTLWIGFTDEKIIEREELSVNGEFVNVEGNLRIVLRDSAGQVVDDYTLDQEYLNAALYFGRLVRDFDTLISGNVRNQTYTLEIIGNFPENSGLFLYVSDGDYYQSGEMTVNGEAVRQDLAFYVYSPIYTMARLLFLVFSVGILAAFTVIYFCAYVFRVKKHILFFITVLIMGMGYTALFTPYTAPDEISHYYTAYRVSNTLTATPKAENPSDELYVRACDTDYNGVISEFYGKFLVPTTGTYAAVINNILGAEENQELILIESDYVTGNPVCYAASGFGIAVGRWLHLSSAVTFYLGRIMNLLLFALLGMLAVRRMPFGKNVLFAVALLPLTLQQVASFSYDSVILSFAFYFTALCFDLIYRAKKISVLDIISMLLCIAVLAAPKAGVYCVVLLLLLLIPRNRAIPKKQSWIFVGGLLAAAVGFFFLFNAFRLSSAVTTTSNAYTLQLIFDDPLQFVELWVNTYFENKEWLAYSAFGSDMAWVNLPVSKTYALAFAALLLLSSARGDTPSERIRMRPLDKTVMWSAVLLTAAGFCAAAFLWTNANSATVAGLQTRYILPVLPLILLLLRNDALVCRKDITGFITSGFVVTHVFYITDLLQTVLFDYK